MKKTITTLFLLLTLSLAVFADGNQHAGKSCPTNQPCLVETPDDETILIKVLSEIFDILS